MWEGVLVDPLGALLGVFVFHAALSARLERAALAAGRDARSASRSAPRSARLAAAVLWFLLQDTQRTVPRQAVPAVLMMVAAASSAPTSSARTPGSSPPR